ncbi:hypothetical protein N7I30_18485 [Aurantimonas litoralis]|nr:hypothetical protein [Aurantimonas litoralis]
MRSSNFIPIVVAGVVGIAIGWAVGPDYDDLQEDLGNQMQGVAGRMQAEIEKLQTSVSELSQQAAAPADDAVAQTQQAIADLGARLDQMGGDFQSRTEALGQSLQSGAGEARDAAAAKLDELAAAIEGLKGDIAAAPAAAPQGGADAAGGDPAALASQVGNTGAILLPGQSAIFGGNPVQLVSISAESGSATLTVAGGDPQDVASGSAIDAGNGCQVTLAGVAAGAAYLGSQDCAGAAASASGEQSAAAAPAAPEPQQAEAAPAQEDQPAAAEAAPDAATQEAQPAPAETAPDAAAQDAPAETTAAAEQPEAAETAQPAAADAPAEQPAAASATRQTVPVGGTASFGETRIFVSAIAEDSATLFAVGGGGRETVAVGSALDAGNGCSVTVEAIENGQVTLASDGCTGGAASSEDSAGPASDDAAAASQETPAEQPDAAASTAPAEGDAAAAPAEPASESDAAAGDGGITVGQTATFGETKVFVSGLGDNGATLYVVGAGRQQVEAGGSADLGDGCAVTVDRIEDRTVYLTANGC